MSFLELRNLHKQFPNVYAVRAISLSAERGEILTLLGPSGCGQTTTLRMVAGLDQPDHGDVLIDGELLSSWERKLFVPPERRGLGMVF